MHQLLRLRADQTPGLFVDPLGCPILTQSFLGRYVYESTKDGRVKEEPDDATHPYSDVMAAIRLGVSRADSVEILRAAGLSRKEIIAVLANRPQPYRADVGTIRRVLRRAKATGDDVRERIKELRRRRDVQKEAA